MEKYFLCKSNEVVNFGDVIEVDAVHSLPNGNMRHQHLECKFLPELLPLLLEQGVVRKEVADDTEDSADDVAPCDAILKVLEHLKALSHKVSNLEKKIESLSNKMVLKDARKAYRK